MSEPKETTDGNATEERSAAERADRSAREVAAWDHALAAARRADGPSPAPGPKRPGRTGPSQVGRPAKTTARLPGDSRPGAGGRE